MNEWYFAYGSNLCIDQLTARIGPLVAGEDGQRVAWLPEHRLLFNMLAEDGERYANLACPGAGVFGVIYSLRSEALKVLDSYETGYERRSVVVTDQHGVAIEATTYMAIPEQTVAAGTPNAKYLNVILRGARQHRLPEAYLREIKTSAGGTHPTGHL